MSKANMDYIIKYNTINKSKIEVNPNCIDVSKYPKKKHNKKSTKELKLIYIFK